MYLVSVKLDEGDTIGKFYALEIPKVSENVLFIRIESLTTMCFPLFHILWFKSEFIEEDKT
jgi:hypothetical protein